MAQEPDRLRQEIEATRASLTRDVDLLAQKTSPTQVAKRRWTTVKEKVMGTTDHARHAASDTASSAASSAQDTLSTAGDKLSSAGSTVSDKASDLTGAVRSAPQAVASQTQGNPIAAGIIAFGVGLLASTLIPVTDAERRAGQELKDRSGDLTDKVKDVATELKDEVSGSAQQAFGEVKETAKDAAQTTANTAKSNADDVRGEARQAVS